jgi:hypothetical protein
MSSSSAGRIGALGFDGSTSSGGAIGAESGIIGAVGYKDEMTGLELGGGRLA